MTNVRGKKVIKANIIGGGAPINANIIQADNSIKSTLSVFKSATTERKGIIRIATDEESIEGISTNTAITPHTLKIATATYIFEQGIASDTWIVEHNLDKRPSITVVDTSGNTQMPDEISYNSDNKIILKFVSSFAGWAYLN